MSKSVEVKLTSELLTRIAKESPKDALKELIWNSCDADANNVTIYCEENELGGLDFISVKDDGHGIAYQDTDFLFGNLGKSEKANKKTSPKGRIYHGKLGEGRYKGFSLGESIKWESRYKEEEEVFEFEIKCNIDDLKRFELSENQHSDSKDTGVAVTIGNLDSTKADIFLNTEDVKLDLLSTFAPYLLAYNSVNIKLNEDHLIPDEHIDKKSETIFEYYSEEYKRNFYCKVLFIKWNSSTVKSQYICGENGVVYEEFMLRNVKGLPISSYIMCSYFDELHKENLLTNLDDGYRAIKKKADELLDEFVRNELSSSASEEIKKLKEANLYPYEGEPANEVDKVERQVFDIIAVEINRFSPKIRKSNKEIKKLTYRLMKEAIKSNPDSVSKILTEVFQLSKVEQDELANLLDYTTLPAIINTSKVISDRLLFLNALEKIIYDKEVSKPIKERTQLHKILLNELWIFGEKYTYGADDISLKNVLKEYIKSMDREELIPKIPEEAKQDLTRIPDICLWQQYPSDRDEYIENLIIELKRPACVLGKKELDQIEDYAFKISKSKVFPKDKTKWNFLLIAKDYDEYVQFKLKDIDKKTKGNFYNSESSDISISVLRWSDLILENKLKYNFLKEKLTYKIEDEMEGMEYVKKRYAKYFD